jgi:hypothetical protein
MWSIKKVIEVNEKQEPQVALAGQWWKIERLEGRPGCGGQNPQCPMSNLKDALVPAGTFIKTDAGGENGIMYCQRCDHGVQRVNPWCIRIKRING